MNQGRASLGFAAIVIVTAVALGAGVTAFSLMPSTPAALLPGADVESMPVITQAFDDARDVEVALTLKPSFAITTPASGRLTRYVCQVGEPLASGTSAMSIDGEPVLTLSTAVPLWRDIAVGDSGSDVQAVQDELVRLGFAINADGTLGAGSLSALTQLLHTAGSLTPALNSLPVGGVLWIPTPSITPATCEQSLGSTISLGDPIITVPGAIAAAAILAQPGDAIEGARELVIDDVTIALPGDGGVSEQASLDAVARTVSYLSAVGTTDPTKLSGKSRLAAPITVGIVPPTAVYSTDGPLGCVMSGGEPLPVRIVGSQLGQTYLVFDAEIPTEVLASPKSGVSCR